MRSTDPRFYRRLALAAACIGLAACGQDIAVDPGVIGDIERCGVDIQMSSSLRLQIRKEAAAHVISAGTLQQVKSSIFDHIPPADRLAVYNSYVACVSSRAALETEIADIDRRKNALVNEIRAKYPNVTDGEIAIIEGLYDKEAAELKSGNLIEARNIRGQTVYALVQLADRHHFDPSPFVGTSEYVMPLGGHKPTPAERQRFMEVCLVAADKPLCEGVLGRLR
jgi:hypothetical protein